MEEGSDIDYIFENVVGGGGLWQSAIVIIMYPIVFASGFPLILHMFTAYAPEFRCFVPGCDDPSMKNESIMDNTILALGATFLVIAWALIENIPK